MQIKEGSIFNASASGFTSALPAVAPAPPNTGNMLMMSTSNSVCDDHVFTEFCLNPVVFTIKDSILYLQSTEADFCPSEPFSYAVKGMSRELKLFHVCKLHLRGWPHTR